MIDKQIDAFSGDVFSSIIVTGKEKGVGEGRGGGGKMRGDGGESLGACISGVLGKGRSWGPRTRRLPPPSGPQELCPPLGMAGEAPAPPPQRQGVVMPAGPDEIPLAAGLPPRPCSPCALLPLSQGQRELRPEIILCQLCLFEI